MSLSRRQFRRFRHRKNAPSARQNGLAWRHWAGAHRPAPAPKRRVQPRKIAHRFQRPKIGNFFIDHAAFMRAMCGMRLTIMAARRGAGNMGYHLPQARLKLGIGPQNRRASKKAAQNLGPMRHDFQTIGLKPHHRSGQGQLIGHFGQLRRFSVFKCAMRASFDGLTVALFQRNKIGGR